MPDCPAEIASSPGSRVRSLEDAVTEHHHHAPGRVHTENVVLDIGEDMGGLIFYAPSDLLGHEIEVVSSEADAGKIHCEVNQRIVNSRTIFTGVFPPVPAGDYQVCRPALRAGERFTVSAGYVREIDWTQ
jgi:hypothetical protein